MWLRQSTAVNVLLGPFVDSGDFTTLETGLTISQADIRLSKNGAAFAQTNNATGATHRENAHYIIPLDTTDTNTLGWLRVAVHEGGALPVWKDFLILPANVYDSLVLGTDLLDANVSQFGNAAGTFSGGRPEVNTSHAAGTAWNSGAIGASTLASDTIAAAKIASGAITSAKFAAGAIDAAAIADNAIDAGAIASDAITAAKIASDAITAAKIASDAITAAKIASGAFTAAKFAANALDAVWSTASRLLTAGTNIVLAKGTGVTGFNDLDAAGIRTAVGLGSANLDTQLGTIDTVVDSILIDTGTDIPGILVSMAGSGFVSLTDSLEALRNRGDVAWVTATGFSTLDAAGVRAAIGMASADLDTQLDTIVADTAELQTDWANGGRLDNILDARATQTSVDTIDTNVDAILADTNDLQTRTPAALVSGRMNASVGAVAAGVLDSYYAKIDLRIDTAQDEYSVVWLKNSSPVESGDITTPQIQVLRRSNGSNLVAATGLSSVGDYGLKYDASGLERITPGEAVQVIVTGTIDGSLRTWTTWLGRDIAS